MPGMNQIQTLETHSPMPVREMVGEKCAFLWSEPPDCWNEKFKIKNSKSIERPEPCGTRPVLFFHF